MTPHQIWSCHVTLASNSENFYFSTNSILNFRKVTKFGGNWLKNKKLQAKNKLSVESQYPHVSCNPGLSLPLIYCLHELAIIDPGV